ncbi:hypothetical protein D3C80_1205640 [compost metagenome]
MRLVWQQCWNHGGVDAHMTQVALAVVRVNRVQVRLRGVRSRHVPHSYLAQIGEFFPFTYAVGQERQGAGGARCVTDAQLRHALVHGLEPVVQALAITDVYRGDGFGYLWCYQFAQPFVDLAEAALLQQRWRVRLVDGVFE